MTSVGISKYRPFLKLDLPGNLARKSPGLESFAHSCETLPPWRVSQLWAFVQAWGFAGGAKFPACASRV